jgi:hypothetical protein
MLKKYVYSLNVNKVLTIHYENIFQYILICFYNISKIYHYFISKNTFILNASYNIGGMTSKGTPCSWGNTYYLFYENIHIAKPLPLLLT